MTQTYQQLSAEHGHEAAAGILALEQARKRDKVQALRNGTDQAVETPAVVEEIKLWPAVGLAAKQGGLGGAWRIWRMAHYFDIDGTGRVRQKELRYRLQTDLKIKRATVKIWLNRAISKGLISAGNDGWYYLASLGKAAVIVGCDRVGRPAQIPLARLAKKGWAAHVWAGYLGSKAPAPKHRENVLQKATGVSPSQQRRYEKTAGVEVKKNFELIYKPPEHLQNVKEAYETEAVFVVRKRKRQPVIYRRLPDTRLSPYNGGRTGRSRKAQKHVNASRSFIMDRPKHKLFYEQPGTASKAAGRCEAEGVTEVFYNHTVSKNCILWRAVRVYENAKN